MGDATSGGEDQHAGPPEPARPAQRPARLVLYAGCVFVVLGAAVLYLGYNGMATNELPPAQAPYLISGGLTGLALLLLGGMALFLYAVLQAQSDLRRDLRQIRGAVEDLAEGLAAATSPAPGSASANGTVMIARGARSYHRPECQLLERAQGVRPAAPDDAALAGLTPCRVCRP
ncbi:MAG: hypothetical protein HY775_06870 [Acidobacteria bacterium]|nr:hypothetical protein [Acidobacteriota bacterium]